MKQTFTALLVVLLLATIVALAAEKAATSDADIVIARIEADYAKALRDADAFYKKYTAPTLKRYGDARDKRIITAGNNAIRRFNTARKEVSDLNAVKMEREIAKIRKSLDAQFGDAPKVTPNISVLKICGVSFKGHTYMVIGSKANWKEADSLCKKMGGHLAYIETTEEMAFLAKTFRGDLWVGATDAHKEGDWRWGNRKPVAKNLWTKDQPSNDHGSAHYAGLWSRGEERMLNDFPLDNHSGMVGFICEWE